MDTDFHKVINMEDYTIYDCDKDILIGDNCWICTRAIILKGSIIGKGSIVGANAVVSKVYDGNNLLIAGNPASIKKYNISMYRDI